MKTTSLILLKVSRLLESLTQGLKQRCIPFTPHNGCHPSHLNYAFLQVVTEECSPVMEKVCTTVPKEACHKVESLWSCCSDAHCTSENIPPFQGTQEVCTKEKVAKEVNGDTKYLFFSSLSVL